jgi:hypothetical protein
LFKKKVDCLVFKPLSKIKRQFFQGERGEGALSYEWYYFSITIIE